MLNWFPKSIWQSLPHNQALPAQDGQTLRITDTIPAAVSQSEVLRSLLWPAATFQASFSALSATGDIAIHFPSPLPLGNPAWDRVVMDWHIARDRAGRFVRGPAVLVLDILQGGNLVAGYIAKTLAKSGIHGLVLHTSQNGSRSEPGTPFNWTHFLPGLRQAVADARRCRDVIARLPLVEGLVGIQGTSLGGFVATLAGAIDDSFDRVFLALTGGDTYGVLKHGRADAARVHRHLLDAGLDDPTLRDSLWQIEPLRVAHRLDPSRTWLFSARFDQVIPAGNSGRLAAAIGLDRRHHRQLFGCHYTCALDARRFLRQLVGAFRQPAGAASQVRRPAQSAFERAPVPAPVPYLP
jgi:hypothetical protein